MFDQTAFFPALENLTRMVGVCLGGNIRNVDDVHGKYLFIVDKIHYQSGTFKHMYQDSINVSADILSEYAFKESST